MAITYAQIKALNAVARSGSFTRAAEELGISQPAVTAQIRKLESTHNMLVFERGPQGVVLTKFGMQLHRITQQVDDLEEAANTLLDKTPGLGAQPLRIATSSAQVFMPVIAEFNRRFPDVRLDILHDTTDVVHAAILEQKADIGLMPDMKKDERLEVMPFCRNTLAAVLPATHPLAHNEETTIRDLRGDNFIAGDPVSATQVLTRALMRKAGLRKQPGLILNSREAVHEAVASGLGITISFERDVPPDPRLSIVPFADQDETVWETVTWRKQRSDIPVVQAFVKIADEFRHRIEGSFATL